VKISLRIRLVATTYDHEIRKFRTEDKRFTPQLDERKKQELLKRWRNAIRMA